MPGYGAYAITKNGLCNHNWDMPSIELANNEVLNVCKRRKEALRCAIHKTNRTPGKFALNLENCEQNANLNRREAACSFIIASGQLDQSGRAWAHAQLGYVELDRKKLKTAIAEFEKSLEIKKYYLFAMQGLAVAKLRLERNDDSKKPRGIPGWWRDEKRVPTLKGIYDGSDIGELAALSNDAASSSVSASKVFKTDNEKGVNTDGVEIIPVRPAKTEPSWLTALFESADKAVRREGTQLAQPETNEKNLPISENHGGEIPGTPNYPIVAGEKTAFGGVQSNQLPDVVWSDEDLNSRIIAKLDNEKICKAALNFDQSNWDDRPNVKGYVRVAKSRNLSVYHCQLLVRIKQDTVAAAAETVGDSIVGRRVALVIGNGSYPNGMSLLNPVNDARAIAASLERLGFVVVLSTDATKAAMSDAMYRFAVSSEGADAAMVFYAGHGMQIDGVNYLMPIDASVETRADLKHRFVAADEFLDDLKTVKGMRMVVLDACRNNPLSRSIKVKLSKLASRSVDERTGLADMKAEGVLIAFATQPNEVASDGTEANSPFTLALLKHLETPNIEIDTMFKRVRTTVSEMTDGVQLPQTVNSSTGEFYLKQN